MNIIVSDPKTRKAHVKAVDTMPYQGMKLGQEVDLSEIGLDGYKGIITGGSDKTGTPMRVNFPGTGRKKLLIYPGVGFRDGEKGERKKRPLRGNVIANDIHQLNIKVTHAGSKSLDELLPAQPKEKKESKK
ncbi:MAG: 30S ribosomal protein S6e [Candidatus Diapherotrites archaeon]|uniref:Small ribosomal subunit protein eS6 n=1 Tax=Candidatus Iainarchaeum sp. TaxID=3101447 RepID=A0A8T4C5U9_9ARCH|nr:30S ribosomal protein S6e [Candidatus Diapherotrites archaeon]